jgi:hypothetical protein
MKSRRLTNIIGGCGLDSLGSGQGQKASTCKQSDEPLASLKYWEYLE